MNYRLAHAIGFHAWEDLADHAPDALARLFRFDERFYLLRRNGTSL